MSTYVFMPKLGKPVEEGVIRKWLVAEGDWVEPYQPIAVIAFAKIDSEVVAPVAGVLQRQCFSQGASVAVGKPIALIGNNDEPIPKVC